MLSFVLIQNNLNARKIASPADSVLLGYLHLKAMDPEVAWSAEHNKTSCTAQHNFSFPNRLREGAAGQFLLQATSSAELRLRSVCLELAKVIPMTTPEGEVTPTWDWTGHTLFLGQLHSLFPLQKHLGEWYFTQPWSDNSVCQSPWAHPSRQSLQSFKDFHNLPLNLGKEKTQKVILSAVKLWGQRWLRGPAAYSFLQLINECSVLPVVIY